jgi:hypothetical protein
MVNAARGLLEPAGFTAGARTPPVAADLGAEADEDRALFTICENEIIREEL